MPKCNKCGEHKSSGMWIEEEGKTIWVCPSCPNSYLDGSSKTSNTEVKKK